MGGGCMPTAWHAGHRAGRVRQCLMCGCNHSNLPAREVAAANGLVNAFPTEPV